MKAGGFLDKLVSRLDRIDPGSLQAHFMRLANERGFLEAIFQSIQEGVLAVDSQGRLLYANRATEQMLGFEYAKLRGRSVMRLLRDLDCGLKGTGKQRQDAAGISRCMDD